MIGNRHGRRRHRSVSDSSFAVSRTQIIKYIIVFAILVYVALLLMNASGSTKPFDEIAGAVEAGLNTENLVKQNTQALKRYYGLNSADYAGVILYTSELSTSAEEVLMVEAKTDDQVQVIRDAVEERLESRKDSFSGFAPEQVTLLDKAQFLVRGRFVFLAVSPDAQDYSAIFTKSL